MAWRLHLFPFRTQKLSFIAPRVVGGTPPVRVGRCRASLAEGFLGFFYYFDKNGKSGLIKLYLFMKGDENHENA